MIPELQNKRILTESAISDLEVSTETLHRSHLSRYLREIPGDFKEIAAAADKRNRVKNHLWQLYGSEPMKWEVETVLKRIIALKEVTELGRDNVMDKAGQHAFKKKHWKNVKRCAICGEEFSDFNAVTLDHKIPVWLGGVDESDNWQLTCSLCNCQKNDHWGSGDTARVESMKRVEGGFFNASPEVILSTLRSKNNPTRYWILQRDEGECQMEDCNSSSRDETIVVCYIENESLPTMDHLKSICITCANNNKYKHSGMYEKR